MTLSADQFRQSARAWLADHVPNEPAPRDGKAARDFALAWQRTQVAGGWAGLAWPKAVGGQALSIQEQIIWFEECARAQAPSPLGPLFVGLNHAGPTLFACGTPEQQATHLPPIIAGEVLWCQGFSEPGAGSDLAGVRTRGRVDGDSLIIDGQKLWSSYADIADWQEVLVRTDPDSSGHAGLSWVILPMRADGVTVRPIRNLAGAQSFCEVFYDSVRVPLDHVVGGLHNGWATAMSTLSFERGTATLPLLIELVARIETLCADCSRERHQLRAHLVGLRAEAAAILAMNYRFALDCDRGVPDAGGSMLRLSFAELAQRATSAAIDLYGIAAPEVL
ncbi:MAG: acyl-CoA dehydrogenase family protein, partial [Xanthomonadales bacterium]|nr:acyl-CoA dehydrogenase family protein [Xanthomonadales bacterium]